MATMTEEHRKYLNTLRRTGIVNMFGAGPFLMEAFPGMTTNESRSILTQWRENFTEDDRNATGDDSE